MGKKVKIIYYAHPVETYGTYFENITQKLIENQYGRIYPVFEFPTLREVIDPNMQKELDALFNEMRTILSEYVRGKISKVKAKAKAKDVSYKFMDMLKNKAHISHDILFPHQYFHHMLD